MGKVFEDNEGATLYLECSCKTPEHMVIFNYDKTDKDFYSDVNESGITIYYQLYQYRSFIKRMLVAIKYIFNTKERFGKWDTTCISNEDLVKLNNFLEIVNKDRENGQKT